MLMYLLLLLFAHVMADYGRCNITIDLTKYILGHTEHDSIKMSDWNSSGDREKTYNWTDWENLARKNDSWPESCEAKICIPNERMREIAILEPELIHGKTVSWGRMDTICTELKITHNATWNATVANSRQACRRWVNQSNCQDSAGCQKYAGHGPTWGEGRCEKGCDVVEGEEKNVTDADVVEHIRHIMEDVYDHSTNIRLNTTKQEMEKIMFYDISSKYIHASRFEDESKRLWLYDDRDEDGDDVQTLHTALILVDFNYWTDCEHVGHIHEIVHINKNKTNNSAYVVAGVFVLAIFVFLMIRNSKKRNEYTQKRGTEGKVRKYKDTKEKLLF